MARSTIPIQYPTPPNRSSSASRGRAVLHQNASTPRQSCSPRARGRRQQEATKPTQPFLGSKMVEKVMNARKSISSINDQGQRDTKQKLRGSTTKHLVNFLHNTILLLFNIIPTKPNFIFNPWVLFNTKKATCLWNTTIICDLVLILFVCYWHAFTGD